jgi:TRAP-type C4-dicarboxylate transport system permease small subunit
MNDPERLERLGVGTLGLLAVLIACYSTATRYFVPSAAPDWGEELVVYLSMWALWLSVGRLVRRNQHVQAEIIVHLVPPRGQRWLEGIHAAVGIVFCAIMGWAGIEVVAQSIEIGERSDTSLHLPLAVYYIGMPVGMGFMVWGYGQRLWRALRGNGHVVEGA